ncbi:hypothetical protein HDIA_0573 [Hartmannibacter diazotrophicus]|uniref:Uncharacterized protein n=1 Tax=Hartmannibacter diazotrophicus TaxID=1482074 RepID=A0A2C9D1K6_9HYPH|nr:hypothetical protein [Hartmannibacter diazotrophicus]SON54114.1 hypothetical protein HDIA_0573 [Hartmannibacter diazotrophicus]
MRRQSGSNASKQKPSHGKTGRDASDGSAKAINERQARDRAEKTERLRAARLAHEGTAPALPVATKTHMKKS